MYLWVQNMKVPKKCGVEGATKCGVEGAKKVPINLGHGPPG